jgi:hypothetical protein
VLNLHHLPSLATVLWSEDQHPQKKIGKSWFYFIFGHLQIPCLQSAPVHPTQ